jgi:hypothetical protein
VSYVGRRLEPLFNRSLIDNTCRDMANHGGERMTAIVKQNTPIGHQPFTENYVPGRLRESIEKKLLVVTRRPNGSVYVSGAETHVEYAPFVENGTGLWGPHRAKYEIRPKRPDGWLSWIDQETGERIFAKRVMHPGSPGNHMFAIGVHLTEHEFHLWGQRMAHTWARRQERLGSRQPVIYVGRGRFA